MTEALLLTASDLRPLREDPAYMREALQAVERAIVAQYAGTLRQHRVVDQRPGEFEGIRVSLMAGDPDVPSGMRVFGNPPHTRAFLLFDGETRALKALMDYGVLNSLRVGATAGVAARYLAPPQARTVGLLGSGWQAAPQVYALKAALPNLERFRVFSPTRAHRESFAAATSAAVELVVEAVDSAEAAVRDVDVVDLCAPGHFDVREPLFEPAWVRPGALVISMAANQYPPEFGQQARHVTAGTDERDGAIPLASVIVDRATPRHEPDEHVIYHLEGGTGQDLFVANWGYEWARSRGLGRTFDLSA
jgi:ornithine cyclodeaminase/alanine dehydrogenase-like protein (mu-crystallin family)